MKVLGIETSCDETAVAIVEDGYKLLANIVNSQIDIHKVYGGVVPEVAARSHIEVMLPVVESALTEANCTWADIDAIAVTQGPGLLGSLLIGVLTARTLAWAFNKPLFPVHHIMGHVYANWLTVQKIVHEQLSTDNKLAINNESIERHGKLQIDNSLQINNSRSLIMSSKQPKFPVLALIVSGGHSQLMLFEDHLKCAILGKTQDDAVGEAFDKVAKILGLPYPGGPSIERLAPLGNPQTYKFPTAKLANTYDFSFSGLKTAVLRCTQKVAGVDYNFPSFQLADKLSKQQKYDIAASFQMRAVETLAQATKKASLQYRPKTVIIGGGVAASKALRKRLTEVLDQPLHVTDPRLCTDNAAMIATLGYFESQNREPSDPLLLTTEPSLKIVTT